MPPYETVIVDGTLHDKLTCAWCKVEFTRRHCVQVARVLAKTYCGVRCARKASNQRWKEGGGSDAYARFKRYKEQMV